MTRNTTYSLRDRHEYFNPYSSKCASCRHFDSLSIRCCAFDEIPDEYLSGEKNHDAIDDNQLLDVIYEAM